MLSEDRKLEILNMAKIWFKETIIQNHIKNIEKLKNPKEFNINPFLITYLANFIAGEVTAYSIAKALIYPRVLGSSINTSFGQNTQKFVTEVLGSFGSLISGIDIEFIDQIDNRKKYCQLKAGPNTINKDDVETIHNHFSNIKNLARTNHLPLQLSDLIVSILYGEVTELSSHYRNIQNKYSYPVFIGQDFWHRLTGDEHFYFELSSALGAVVLEETNDLAILENTINELANSEFIQTLAKKINTNR